MNEKLIDVRDFVVKLPIDRVYTRMACFTCTRTDTISNDAYHVCIYEEVVFNEWFYKLAKFPNITSICIHYPLTSLLYNLLLFPSNQFTQIDLSSTSLSAEKAGFVVELCKKYKLKRLLLGSNRLAEGTAKICNYLATVEEETLEVLDLDVNRINDLQSWNAILLLIRNTHTLRKLTVSFNRSPNDIKEFMKALFLNQSLLYVCAVDCFTVNFKRETPVVTHLIKQNLRIRYLSFDAPPDNEMLHDRFCTRNRKVFAPESVYNSLLNIGLALFSLNLPFYLFLYAFDWMLCVEQSLFVENDFCAPFDTVELHLKFNKFQWLNTFLTSFRCVFDNKKEG